MNGHGGKRPGAGRPKGAASRANEEVRQEAAASGELPLAYMLRIMRDPSQPVGRRDDMANAAAPPPSRSRAGRSERQRRPPYHDHRDGECQETFWSPKWSRTRDHGSVLNGTDRHARSISQYKSTLVRTERNEPKRPPTNFSFRRVYQFRHRGVAAKMLAPWRL